SSAEEPLWTATFEEIPGTAFVRTIRGQNDVWDTQLFSSIGTQLPEAVTQADDFSFEVVFTNLGGEYSPYFNIGLFAVPGSYEENGLWIWGDGNAHGNEMYCYVKESLAGKQTAQQFKVAGDTSVGGVRFLRYAYTAADRSVRILFVMGDDDVASAEEVIADYNSAAQGQTRVPATAEFALTHFAFMDSGGDPHLWNFEWNMAIERVKVVKNGQTIVNEDFADGPGVFNVFTLRGAENFAVPACALDGFVRSCGRSIDQQATVLPVPGGALRFIAADMMYDEYLSYAVFGHPCEIGSLQNGWGLTFETAIEETMNGSAASFGIVRYGVSTVPPEMVPTLNSMFLQVQATNAGSDIRLTPTLYAYNSYEEQATASGSAFTVVPGTMFMVKIGLDIADRMFKAEILGLDGTAKSTVSVAIPENWTFDENTTINTFEHSPMVSFGDGLITDNVDFENRAKGTWLIDNVSLYAAYPQVTPVTDWSVY
ncbi:MAG TPA: hypothetical protein PLG59_13770, partial [bacterium]|nr:hypothetical protein [bacterium]